MDSLVEMSLRIPVALLVFFLVVPAAASPVAGSTAAPTTYQVTDTPEPVEENTTFSLQLRPNGDARWTITDTYALSDANETEAFRDLGESFAEGNAQTGWLASFREARGAATEATGREMEITDVERDYVVGERHGRLVLSFTWTNFATVEGDRIVVGDAFNTTDGTWFRTLTADQRLIIASPTGYGVRSGPTAVEDGELRFEGPRTFEPGYLSIVYPGDDASPTTQTTATSPGPEGGLFEQSPVLLGGVALLVLGLVVAVGYMTMQGHTEQLPGGETDDGGDPANADSEAASQAATESGGEDEVDLTLLSDEERVERLLEQNGGRMKQAQIVKETGWSNAKVSQLLSAMDEDDRIDKLRIGRENLISFPDEEIGDFDE